MIIVDKTKTFMEEVRYQCAEYRKFENEFIEHLSCFRDQTYFSKCRIEQIADELYNYLIYDKQTVEIYSFIETPKGDECFFMELNLLKEAIKNY